MPLPYRAAFPFRPGFHPDEFCIQNNIEWENKIVNKLFFNPLPVLIVLTAKLSNSLYNKQLTVWLTAGRIIEIPQSYKKSEDKRIRLT
jgi:hypothetical protein